MRQEPGGGALARSGVRSSPENAAPAELRELRGETPGLWTRVPARLPGPNDCHSFCVGATRSHVWLPF